MPKEHDDGSVDAEYGTRMISLTVRFWTDDIAKKKGKVHPKCAWGSGAVRMVRNDTHDIIPGAPMTFNSLMELPGIIEKLLIREGITIYPSRKMKRYMGDDE